MDADSESAPHLPVARWTEPEMEPKAECCAAPSGPCPGPPVRKTWQWCMGLRLDLVGSGPEGWWAKHRGGQPPRLML